VEIVVDIQMRIGNKLPRENTSDLKDNDIMFCDVCHRIQQFKTSVNAKDPCRHSYTVWRRLSVA